MFCEIDVAGAELRCRACFSLNSPGLLSFQPLLLDVEMDTQQAQDVILVLCRASSWTAMILVDPFQLRILSHSVIQLFTARIWASQEDGQINRAGILIKIGTTFELVSF